MPGRYNFPQGAIYRLKLTNIPVARASSCIRRWKSARHAADRRLSWPTMRFRCSSPKKTSTRCCRGNFVTKVIYLPDAEFQELALAGVETLVSTRLDPGLDPIVEADRRGTILAIIRIGNKDLEIRPWRSGRAAWVAAVE